MNQLEALAEWGVFSKLKAPFYLYVPPQSIDSARRICDEQRFPVAEIWTYHLSLDQVRFTQVYRSPNAPKPAPIGSDEQRQAVARSREAGGRQGRQGRVGREARPKRQAGQPREEREANRGRESSESRQSGPIREPRQAREGRQSAKPAKRRKGCEAHGEGGGEQARRGQQAAVTEPPCRSSD